MSDKDKIPQVIMAPEVQERADADPDLQAFLRKFKEDALNAMEAVKAGRHPDFGKAMEALGYEATAHDSPMFSDELLDAVADLEDD